MPHTDNKQNSTPGPRTPRTPWTNDKNAAPHTAPWGPDEGEPPGAGGLRGLTQAKAKSLETRKIVMKLSRFSFAVN